MIKKSQSKTLCRPQWSGFTLIEVLVAVGVGGIVFITLYAGLAQGFASVQSAHYRLRATQILTEKLEVTRLYNWNQINTPGFVPAQFTEYYSPNTNKFGNVGIVYTGTFTVTNAAVASAYQDTMRRVIAQVTWVNGHNTNRLNMETLISQYGIQNYIY